MFKKPLVLLWICVFSFPALAAEDSAMPAPVVNRAIAVFPSHKEWDDEAMEAERKWFYRSVIAHGAGTAADAWSSWNRPEVNSLLRDGSGRFTAKGVMIKAGFLAGTTAAEYAILRSYSPKWLVRTFIIMNYALGAEYSVIAISNRVRINHHAAR